MITTQLSTGFLIGSIAVGLLLVIGIVATILGLIFGTTGDAGFPRIAWLLGGFGYSFVILLIAAIIDFPFSAPYHEYKPVSGIVQSVESRLIASGQSGGGSTQVFPVQIGGQTYKCDDTRCAQLHPGSDVTLLCIKEWQFNGTPGWECNWGKLGLNS